MKRKQEEVEQNSTKKQEELIRQMKRKIEDLENEKRDQVPMLLCSELARVEHLRVLHSEGRVRLHRKYQTSLRQLVGDKTILQDLIKVMHLDIRLGKSPTLTNALAYYDTELITAVKMLVHNARKQPPEAIKIMMSDYCPKMAILSSLSVLLGPTFIELTMGDKGSKLP